MAFPPKSLDELKDDLLGKVTNDSAAEIAGAANSKNPIVETSPKDKSKLIGIPFYKSALKSAGFQDQYRYYFRVKQARKDGSTPPSGSGTGPGTTESKQNATKNTGGYHIKEITKWADTSAGNVPSNKTSTIIALDIPPQSVTITSPFAISVVATNRGILEEHNGLVFKTIVISGTTGVLPRSRAGSLKGQQKNTFFTNFLPEASGAVSGLISGVTKLSKTVFGDSSKNVDKNILNNYTTGRNSGFGKFWRLHNFLLAYAEAKKEARYKDARLVFGCPKDNVEYVCTPIQFEMKRDASRPMLYHYTIVLKAWEVTRPFFPDVPELPAVPSPRNPGAIKDLTNSLMSARNVIAQAKNVLLGVNNDIQSVLNVAAQGIFLLKDTVGLAGDILDFPAFFLNNIDRTIVGAFDQLKAASDQAFQSGDERIKRVLGGQRPFDMDPSTFAALSVATGGVVLGLGAAAAAGKASVESKVAPGGESADSTTASSSSPTTLAAKKMLNYAFENPAIGSQILIDQIVLPDSLQAELESQREQAMTLNSGDIRELQQQLQDTSNNLAQSIGLMDTEYARTYGLPAPVIGRAPTEDDIILMAALQEQKDGFGSILSTGEILKDAPSDPFVSANDNLPEDEQIDTPASSFLTRINNGENLQDLARRTLGDASRWREIAILNDLKPPYVSFDPISRPFTAPNGRTVLVSDTEDMAIGQIVTIVGTVSTRRKILNIENLDSVYRITFDGQDNLSSFDAAPVKKLLFTQPGTVTNGDPILVPSDGDADDLLTLRPTPTFSRLSQAEKVFKIDLAVADNGDLKIGGDGDIVRSYGYDNAVQALKLGLTIEEGELERHLDYGVAVPVGSRNSDLTVEDLDALVRHQVTSDPRFTDVDTQVKVDGSVVRIEVVARGAEGTGLIPVEFRTGQPE